MAAVMLASPQQHRQKRRCITVKDVRFAPDTAVSPAAAVIQAVATPQAGYAAFQGADGSITIAEFAMKPTRRARCHTVMHMFADPENEDSSPKRASKGNSAQSNAAMSVHRRTQRAKTMGAEPSKRLSVSVIAPGGGTGVNSSVYAALGRKEGFNVQIVGQSRAPYDRYPPAFANDGAPPPNLESFALDVLARDGLATTDCLVVGSRGGQVVLPTLWRACGGDVPPAVVMNGGCAMSLPTAVAWPENAVTFLLLGGNDYFRGSMSDAQYLSDTQQRVPEGNTTTAILLVKEMSHMPQAEMLSAILLHMICAVTSWKSTETAPLDEFATILANLSKGGWSGKFAYKTGTGHAWKVESFA